MPVTKSAEKKMRKDKFRTKFNKKRKDEVKNLIKAAQKNPSAQNIKKAQSAVAKLAKIKIIHKNKAARLESQLARLAKITEKPKELKKILKKSKKKNN